MLKTRLVRTGSKIIEIKCNNLNLKTEAINPVHLFNCFLTNGRERERERERESQNVKLKTPRRKEVY